MERAGGLRVPSIQKAARKKRRASPLPEAAALPGSRAGVSQLCRRRLFWSSGPRGPQPARLNKKSSGKNLPKIKENVEYTEESSSYNQSNQATVRETTGSMIKEEEPEESCVPLKESKKINFESKESLKNADVTSSTELTLPTGVSTILLECLDEDTSSDSLKTYSSPETFRDDDLEKFNFYSVGLGKYKNSTLLESSKAVTIDKIPEISNLSAILEPVPEDFPDQCIRRERPSNCYYSSSALNISTTLAGKKLCKITAARERTTDLKSCICCSSPLGPESKRDNQTAKAKRLEKKESSSNPLEGGSSSFRQLDAPEEASAGSEGLTTEVQPTKQTDAVEPLCNRREICSIVRMSPSQRPSQLQQVAVNWKEFCLLRGVVPEDTITSTRNWICRKKK